MWPENGAGRSSNDSTTQRLGGSVVGEPRSRGVEGQTAGGLEPVIVGTGQATCSGRISGPLPAPLARAFPTTVFSLGQVATPPGDHRHPGSPTVRFASPTGPSAGRAPVVESPSFWGLYPLQHGCHPQAHTRIHALFHVKQGLPVDNCCGLRPRRFSGRHADLVTRLVATPPETPQPVLRVSASGHGSAARPSRRRTGPYVPDPCPGAQAEVQRPCGARGLPPDGAHGLSLSRTGRHQGFAV